MAKDLFTQQFLAEKIPSGSLEGKTWTAYPDGNVPPSAVLSDVTVDDPTDTFTFDANTTGTLYWATSLTTDSPSYGQIKAGVGGGILESGDETVSGSGILSAPYTAASGADGATRKLSYFIDPVTTALSDSNIIRENFTLNLKPEPFTAGMWTVADLATDGAIEITIISLPEDNGYSISQIQYRLDGGSWTNIGGTTPADYEITGLTNTTEYDVELRAVNAQGNANSSDIKTVTPTEAVDWVDALVARWEADAGIVAEGTALSTWTDSINGYVLGLIHGVVDYEQFGGPNESPTIALPAGASLRRSTSGWALPLGNTPRTIVTVASIIGNAVGAGTALPMYGLAVDGQQFGIQFNVNEVAEVFHGGAQTTGTTSFADSNYRVIAATYGSGVETLYVDNIQEGQTTGLTLDTQVGNITVGRNLLLQSKGPIKVSAIFIFDGVLTETQLTSVYNFLNSKYIG